MTYTRAGGSYIVARENFGPRIAQIAAAALLIDYVVTVAVQAAAGTVAVVSAMPSLGPYSLEITVGVVLIMCYANLRGLREAGRPFAMPTYFFVVMMTLMIVTGVVRELFWGLPHYDAAHLAGAVPVHQADGLVMGATILVLLRAFANGGSSLTGVEAISNTVNVVPEAAGRQRAPGAHRDGLHSGVPAGRCRLSGLRHPCHSVCRGYPSVLSEIARAVFGNGVIGNVLYVLVQMSTAAILYTGANTSFNGFPALANFVAEDRFLPRQLMQTRSPAGVLERHHRAHGAVGGAAGGHRRLGQRAGAVLRDRRVHRVLDGRLRHDQTPSDPKDPGWRYKLAINLSAGILSTVVVGIFAIAKFTEGAWLVVVVFPLLVFGLMRLNREYRAEAAILEKFRTDRPDLPKYARHRVFVCVNSVDLAVLEALRYGKRLRADELTAVHFMIDAAHAEQLRKLWEHFGLDMPLRVIDCPDRRLIRAAQELVNTTCATSIATPT